MIKLIIVLIALIAPLTSLKTAEAAPCPEKTEMVITSPRVGIPIQEDGVVFRGYLCKNFPLIEVRNLTTKESVITDTRKICEGKGDCLYTFAAYMGDLALGSNRLMATIPGENYKVEIEVIRTAFAFLE